MRSSVQGIFRSSGGNNGETHESSPPRCPSPATPTHRAIFRRPKQTYSPSAHSASSEESVIAALPCGPSWPPLTIPESESADTNRLGLSRPIRTNGSSASRHDINASTSSEREQRQKPTYYKIQMRNGMAKLAAGDDSSVNIAEDHNDRIQLTPIRERKHRIIRASNITESSSSSGSPRRIGAEHQQTWEVQNWEVVGNGQIVAAPLPAHPGTPSSMGSSRQRNIATSTPNAPKKTFLRSMRTPATPPLKAHTKNDAPESPPRLQKASFDTISSGASSRSDNSFYNEMLELAEPESPPHLDRMSCPDKVFSEDGSKVSKGSKSKSSRSGRSSESAEKKDEPWSAGFIWSQVIDFISVGPCCQMDSICRGRGRGGQVVS
mmetsp:Transcript_19737/g.28121  ORF Transcript_19737/g.28121 Transcript_19737/m.28121 type:complete len:378 (-) Transcript_19737:95-1228(-)|eukprot:CAMPEP_0201686700 /NCGR_PEP_ID=MMETSP0578-20130828/1044_1 /ASSEMBLY_ACC=CAM_ASM_000663 /TAXON_ID=267565 /ORGANISM="Skeletonema grethea, Strain CCMP 1804" /LENGTH=377 /DNA_ID=CAMNT_0048170785 /DNA_START=56 /DNA_END=1189 /DNA_ORIENTATION=+